MPLTPFEQIKVILRTIANSHMADIFFNQTNKDIANAKYGAFLDAIEIVNTVEKEWEGTEPTSKG